MKKSLMLIALAMVVTGLMAQDEEGGGMTSKKGEAILPETDDWALMIDARPVMFYLGNMLNGNTGNVSPTWGYPGTPLAITGKMFKDEKTAYRGMLRLGFGSATQYNYVTDDVNVATDPNAVTSDSWKFSYNNIVIGGGLEMRRGKTRLQGYYGGMLIFGMSGSSSSYTYGNGMTATNTSPTSTVWTPTVSAGSAPSRVTENKAGSTMTIGLRGFVGAEYFIFPKMSIGAEFGWGLGMSSTGEGETKTDSWDATVPPGSVKSTTTKTGKSSTFGIDTDINTGQLVPTGSLNLALHF